MDLASFASSPTSPSTHHHHEPSSPSNSLSCRICRLNHGPLCRPCKCSGSIAYVHEDCLLGWLQAKYGEHHAESNRAMTCEVCGENFLFRKVYAENAPKQLSITQFLTGLLQLFGTTFIKIARPIVVLCVWMVLLPFITGFMWNFYFNVNRQKYESTFSFFGRENVVPWLVDAACGSFVCVAIILCCFLIAAFKEFVQTNPDIMPVVPDPPQQPEQQQPPQQDMPQHQPPHAQRVDQPNPHQQDDFPQQNVDPPAPPAQQVMRLAAQHQEQAQQEAQETTIEQLLGLDGPIRNLFESLLIAFIFIVATLNVFVFVPYTAGYHINDIIIGLGSRQTRARARVEDDVSLSFLTHCFILGKGYTIQAVGFLLWSVSATLYQHFFHAEHADNHYINNAIYYTRLIYLFFKVTCVMAVNFFVTPILLGFMVNFSSASFFDVTVQSRIQSFFNAPISLTIFHFILGMMVMLNFGSIVRTLRTFLRKEVLWFLTNPDDPEFHYFRNVVQNSPLVHIRRVMMTLVLFSIVILSLVRTPLKFVRQLCPSFFPLRLPHHGSWSSELLFNFDMLFIFILPQMGISAMWSKISRVIEKWVEIVSEPLGLRDYFLEAPAANEDARARNEDDSDDSDVESLDEDMNAINSIRLQDPAQIKFFPLRMTAFLTVAWCTCIAFVSFLLPLPIVLGRLILLDLLELKSSDFSTWIVGYYLLYAVKLVAVYTYQQMSSLEMMDVLKRTVQYGILFVKLLFLGSLWFVFLASILGLCFYKLFLFPFFPLDLYPKPPHDHFLSVGWMVGSVISQLAWISSEGNFLHKYRREFQRIKRDGWLNLNMSRIMRNLIMPWFIGMTLFLYIPAFFSSAIVPLVLYRGLGLPVAEVVMKQQLVRRYSNILLFTLVSSVYAVKKLARISHQLYEKIFDQQYVVRQALVVREESSE